MSKKRLRKLIRILSELFFFFNEDAVAKMITFLVSAFRILITRDKFKKMKKKIALSI